ncbi:MAG: diphosphomevalonate decarboxylase [Bacteroidetes bacterium]|nr:diphosphomevalonate decarboxylase [Bacteroidota bacterium]
MKAAYRCPSNIALVKYWGKKEGGTQLPANPSISLTLGDLYADTSVEIVSGNVSGKPAFDFLFQDQPKPSFTPKLDVFFRRIWDGYELVRNHRLLIRSTNNFPHGTGIASSAAGFGALALCIYDLQQQLYPLPDSPHHEASRIARLGSGSACRSLFAAPAIWGEHEKIAGSSDEYAIPFSGEIAPELQILMDAVLIVDAGEKKVSSSEGHGLLQQNPYASARYGVAKDNLIKICNALETGSLHRFISIVESEALQLHAMMMVSNPYYILMRPGTLSIIENVWAFRENTGVPLMFTLDAGANVHLLFPKMYTSEVTNFIEGNLLLYCQNRQYLCSTTGVAPQKLH